MSQTDVALNFDTDDDGLDLKQILTVLRRRWWVGALVLGSIIGLTVYWTLSLKPVYQATGKILLKQAESGLKGLTGFGDVGELAAIGRQGDPISTQAELIQSQPLVQEVIDQLQLKDKEDKKLRYEEFLKHVSVKPVRGTDILAISYQSDNPREAQRVVEALMSGYIKNDIQSNRLQSKAIVDFIQRQLPQTENAVVKAEAAVRQFKEAHQVVALKEEAKASVELGGDMIKEITETQAKLADVNAQTQDLQRRVGLNSQQAIALSALSQSPAVQQAFINLQKIQDELAVQKTRYRSPHPVILGLERKQAAVQGYLQERIDAIVGPQQGVTEAQLQMTELQRNIIAELVKSEVNRLGVYNRLGILTRNYGVLQDRSRKIPRLEEALRQLERKLEVAQSTYEMLLKSLQEAQLSQNKTIGNATIASPSLLADKPVSPKLLLNLFLGGFVGAIAATALMWLLETNDVKVRDRDQLKRIFGYPFLGAIPDMQPSRRARLIAGGSELILGYGQRPESRPLDDEDGDMSPPAVPVLDDPYSPIANEFQKLQTNLRLVNTSESLKVVVISSTMPGEGKSTVSANLAAALVQAGQRVILIDADMRKPTQHEKWNALNVSGLSNVLAGMADPDKVVQQLVPNLNFISAGTQPPNPVALLESQRMKDLLANLSKSYDYVIVDTPPLLLVADALIVTRMAGGLILIARPEVLLSTSAATVKSTLEQAKVNVLGLVVNGISDGDAKRYGYSYGYGYKSYGSYGRSGYGGGGDRPRTVERPIHLNGKVATSQSFEANDQNGHSHNGNGNGHKPSGH
jgi:polysaccharide biosynthesis transport protein